MYRQILVFSDAQGKSITLYEIWEKHNDFVNETSVCHCL